MSNEGQLRVVINGPWAARLVSNPSAREWLQPAFQRALDDVIEALGGDGLYIVRVEELLPRIEVGHLRNCAVTWTGRGQREPGKQNTSSS